MSPKGSLCAPYQRETEQPPPEVRRPQDMNEHTIIAYSEADQDYVYVDVTLNDDGKYEDASGNLYNPDTHKPVDQDFTEWADETAARSHTPGTVNDALGSQSQYRPTPFDLIRKDRGDDE